MNKIINKLIVIGCLIQLPVQAQFATIGGGILTSERPVEPVFELNAQTAPFFESRAYLTLSWTDESASPTIISAVERPVVSYGEAFTSLGAGLLLLEFNDYKPKAMLVSSTIIPISIPRTSMVMIASSLPFDDFEWSVVFKVGYTFWFKE